MTIPVAVLERLGVRPGDELKVETDDGGRIILELETSLADRRLQALERWAGKFTGLYPPGYLDELRDEWER